MKKVFFVAALSMSVFMTNAQQSRYPQAEFGVKGGLDIANVNVEGSNNPDTKVSGYLGLLAHIHLSRQFAFQPELLFSGQGFKETMAGKDYTTALNYITIPLLGQLMLGNGFRIETGPQPGVLVSAHTKSDGSSTNDKNDFKTGDLSWVFGIGYVGPMGFGVDARYNLGLSNISDDYSEKIHNSVLAIGVFYQIRN